MRCNKLIYPQAIEFPAEAITQRYSFQFLGHRLSIFCATPVWTDYMRFVIFTLQLLHQSNDVLNRCRFIKHITIVPILLLSSIR